MDMYVCICLCMFMYNINIYMCVCVYLNYNTYVSSIITLVKFDVLNAFIIHRLIYDTKHKKSLQNHQNNMIVKME